MNVQQTQMNQWWKTYITHTLEKETTTLPSEVCSFLQSLHIDFMDYETSEYGEYGDIAVRYMDIFYQEEEIEIRRIDSATNDFLPTWGFMHQHTRKHFDSWVRNEFSLDEPQTSTVLGYVDFFLRNTLTETNN